jgi:hypothetical protein
MKVLEKCMKMRAAKERRRQARAETPDFAEIGRAVFDGPLFGGLHTVRVIGRSDATVCDIEVDGRVTCCKTQRGARALLMRRICHPRTALNS